MKYALFVCAVALAFLSWAQAATLRNLQNVTEEPVRYYGCARGDRGGRHLLKFLFMDFLAKKNGGVVGGACPDDATRDKHYTFQQMMDHVHEAEKDIEMLHLDHLYKYECPTQEDLDNGRAVTLGFHQTEGIHLTSAFMETVRQRAPDIPYKTISPDDPDQRKRVAIHLRRGDISPCSPHGFMVSRYISNQFYLKLWDDYLPTYCGENVTENCKVTIYSESDSVEPFTPFEELGAEIHLDGSIADVWIDFMSADVMVASQSAFSFAPAALNPNVVIFPSKPLYRKTSSLPPLDGWVLIEENSPIRVAAEIDKKQVIRKYCGGH